jgi:hypothetical protein
MLGGALALPFFWLARFGGEQINTLLTEKYSRGNYES